MFFYESDDFITEPQKDLIGFSFSQEGDFPFYYTRGSVNVEDGASFLCHTLITRIEERERVGNVEELGYNSPNTNFYLDIARNLLNKAGLDEPKEWLRAAVNLTYNHEVRKSLVHEDHEFPHRQILIYLNDCVDKGATTVFLDKDGNKVKEVAPKQFKGLIFDSVPHYMTYPKEGSRIVAVFTFR